MNVKTELLKTTEVMERLKISRSTLYRFIDEGMPIKFKKPLRFVYEDIIKWLEEREK